MTLFHGYFLSLTVVLGLMIGASLRQIHWKTWWALLSGRRRQRIRYVDRSPFNAHWRFLTISQHQQVPLFWAFIFLWLCALTQTLVIEAFWLRAILLFVAEGAFLVSFYTLIQLFMRKPNEWKLATYLLLLYATIGFYTVNYVNFLHLYSETAIIFEMLSGIVLIMFSSFYLLKLLTLFVESNFAHTIQIIAEFTVNIVYHGLITGTALLGASGGQAAVAHFVHHLGEVSWLTKLLALSYYGLADFFSDLAAPSDLFTHFAATPLYIHMISLLFGASYTWIILANLISANDSEPTKNP